MSDGGVWGARLHRVPDDAGARALADAVYAALGGVIRPSARPVDLVQAVGWRYRERPIGSATSAVESALVPLIGGAFSVLVNTRFQPSQERALWLTAHEIGHSFFYDAGSPPQRIIASSLAEERFCDAFADGLVGTTARGGAEFVEHVA